MKAWMMCAVLLAGWLVGCGDEGGASDGGDDDGVGLVVQGCAADERDLPFYNPDGGVAGCEALANCLVCGDFDGDNAWVLESDNDLELFLAAERDPGHPQCEEISFKVTSIEPAPDETNESLEQLIDDLMRDCRERRDLL